MEIYLIVPIVLGISHAVAFLLGRYLESKRSAVDLRSVKREMDFYIAQYRATKVKQGTSEPHPSFRRSSSLKPH